MSSAGYSSLQSGHTLLGAFISVVILLLLVTWCSCFYEEQLFVTSGSPGEAHALVFQKVWELCSSDGLDDSREAEKGVSYSRFPSTIGPEKELVNVVDNLQTFAIG